MDNFPFFPMKNDSFGNQTFVFTYQPLDSTYFSKEENLLNKYETMIGKDSYANLVATATLIVTLIIFIYQNYKSVKEKKLAIRQNWFMTVIVQPNLNNINNFYENTVLKLNEHLCSIRRSHNTSTITVKKAKANRSIKNIKNDFFDDFVTIIQSYDKELATNTEKLLNNLQDLCSESIDNYSTIEDRFIRKKIFENRASLISLLYEGINKKKKKWYHGFYKGV